MAASWHPAATAVILVLLHHTGFSNARSLEILPSGEIQSRSIGSSIMLTCKPNVDNPALISHMEWLDPQNRTIDDTVKQGISGNMKPSMYTEARAGNILALLFTNLQEEQGGKYTCRATYANTDQLVKSVTIDTIVSIAWDDAPLNQYPILGEDFNIKCKVRARPSPAVDWLYNGELITGSDDHRIIDTHALKLKKVTEDDDGIYTCRASVTTTGELKERNIRVEVLIKPVIEELDSTIEIIEGETTDIVCKARGKPPPKFTWVKSITHQDLSTADRFAVNKDTGVMSIRNVNRDDDGEYQCTAENAAGTANMNIRLNVIVKPKIMEFVNKTIPVNGDVEIMCKAFGRPPPEIQFRKHTSEKRFVLGGQSNDDRIILQSRKDDRNGETIGILTIRNVQRSDDGLYECIGKNKGGNGYKNGHLTVEFPPSFEATDNRTVFAWSGHPGNLTCIATSIPNATIEWKLFNGHRFESTDHLKIVGNGPISSLIVDPIDNRFFNSYTCVASNIHGVREHLFILKEGRRPGQLAQVRIAQMTATTVLFNLVLPPQQDELPIRRITVQYKTSDRGWDSALNRTWTANSTYILEGLEPQRNYDFRFAPGNEVGLANWDKQITESTQPKSRPEVPKMRSHMAPGVEYEMSPFSNQYEVAWLLPPDNGEPITGFEVTYCPLKRISGEWEEVPNSCKTETERGQRTTYWLKFLSADTYYKIEVRVRNLFGLSEPGSIRIKTSRGQDPPVVHHQGALISSGAIIGIVIAILVVIIIIIDVICCCAQKTGIIFYMCERSRRKPVDEEDAKLGRDEKEPLREEKKITPIIDSGLRRETSITFDGKRSISKTGFVGKDSAV